MKNILQKKLIESSKIDFLNYTPNSFFEFEKNNFLTTESLYFKKFKSLFTNEYFLQYKSYYLKNDDFFYIKLKEKIIDKNVEIKINNEIINLDYNSNFGFLINSNKILFFKNFNFLFEKSLEEIKNIDIIVNENLVEYNFSRSLISKLKKINVFSIIETLLFDLEKNFKKFDIDLKNKYSLYKYINYFQDFFEKRFNIENYKIINNINKIRTSNFSLKFYEKNNFSENFKKLLFYDNSSFSSLNYFLEVPKLNKKFNIFEVNKNIHKNFENKDYTLILKNNKNVYFDFNEIKIGDFVKTNLNYGVLFLDDFISKNNKIYQKMYINFEIIKYKNRIFKKFFDINKEIEKFRKKIESVDLENYNSIKINNNNKLKIINDGFTKIPSKKIENIEFNEIPDCELQYYINIDFDKIFDFKQEISKLENELKNEVPINVNIKNYKIDIDINDKLKNFSENYEYDLELGINDKITNLNENFEINLNFEISDELKKINENFEIIFNYSKIKFKKFKVGQNIILKNVKTFAKIFPNKQYFKIYSSNSREESNLYNLKVGKTLLKKEYKERIVNNKKIKFEDKKLVFGEINNLSIKNFKDFVTFDIEDKYKGRILKSFKNGIKFIPETNYFNDKEIENYIQNNIGKFCIEKDFKIINCYNLKIGKTILYNNENYVFDLKTNLKTNLNKIIRKIKNKKTNLNLYHSKIGKNVLYNNKKINLKISGYWDSKYQYVKDLDV